METETTIRQIVYGSAEYDAELQLRNKVLRIPLGLSLFDEELAKEVHDHHLGIYFSGKLVGVLILTQLKKEEIQMRQVAVDEAFQGKGRGAALVKEAEILAKNMGCTKMVLHARANVTGFYEKLGYRMVGEEFTEVSIPHRAMEKTIE